jgi:drug/metabolite transporter (DMT)-like permease
MASFSEASSAAVSGAVHASTSSNAWQSLQSDEAMIDSGVHSAHGQHHSVPVAAKSTESSAAVASTKPMQGGAGGLWNRTDQAGAAPVSRSLIIFLVIVIMMGYAFAMIINGAASKLLRPRIVLPSVPGEDPLAGLGFAVRVADPLFLLSSFRVCAIGIMLTFMWLRKDISFQFSAASVRPAIRAVIIGICNAGGYFFYMSLTTYNGQAIWSAMTGLYVLFPVLYGIVWKGESRTTRKLVGIACCVAAAVFLGMADGVKEPDPMGPADAPWYLKLVLFLTCISVWGVCDAFASYVGRELHHSQVAMGTGFGFLVVAWVAACLSYLVTIGSDPVPVTIAVGGNSSATGSSNSNGDGGSSSPAVGLLLLAAAQGTGVLAWYSTVKLGTLADASSFLPITTLYTCMTSLFSVTVLGESMAWQGWMGLVLAAVGTLTVAMS